MNIQRRGRGKKLIISLILLALITAVIIGGVFFLQNNLSGLTNKEPTTASKVPLFSFDQTPGWWRGATNETSMAIFDSNDTHSCFLSTEYKSGTVNIATELKEMQQELAKNGNYTMNELGIKNLSLQTASGPQPYELHQFSIATPNGAEKVKEGQEVGYVQLAGNYVKLSGYCDLSNQLATTIPALEAIYFAKH